MDTLPLIVFVLCLGAATVVAVMALTAVRGRQLGVVAVVDVAWGSGFVVVALVSAVVGQLLGPDGGATFQRWFVFLLVAAWGGRLAWHVRSRFNGEHAGEEDPRYAEMLGGSLAEVGLATAVKRVFVVQGTAMWVVSLPVMVGAVTDLDHGPVLVVGALVWAVGLAFETVGDRQLTAYKAEPKQTRPTVMDRGLWGWTRHPNYFGDATVWWGLWLAAGLASGWGVGVATVVAPVAMTFFIRNVTGAKLLEKKMSRRDGWDDYAARVPMFFPLPPGVKQKVSRG